MIALLGNLEGKVDVDTMPGYVYFRANVYRKIGGLPKMEVGLAHNTIGVPSVYDLQVLILDGKVIRTVSTNIPEGLSHV